MTHASSARQCRQIHLITFLAELVSLAPSSQPPHMLCPHIVMPVLGGIPKLDCILECKLRANWLQKCSRQAGQPATGLPPHFAVCLRHTSTQANHCAALDSFWAQRCSDADFNRHDDAQPQWSNKVSGPRSVMAMMSWLPVVQWHGCNGMSGSACEALESVLTSAWCLISQHDRRPPAYSCKTL